MSDGSTIEWLNHLPGYKPASWNPTTGCTKISAGCKNCYAEGIARHYWEGRPFTSVQVHPERIETPFHWKLPRVVFVGSMTDLFHKDIPEEYIKRVFLTMMNVKRHIFIMLTKRPERMVEVLDYMQLGTLPEHIWLGVTVENPDALWRVEQLLRTPATVHFVSAEPLLSEINLTPYLPNNYSDGKPVFPNKKYLDWVVAGCESGPHARPFYETWARALKNQCASANVPFFYKQGRGLKQVIKLPELDGRQWMQYPSYVTQEPQP